MFEAWLQIKLGNLLAVQYWAEDRGLFEFIDSPLKADVDAPYEYRMHKYELTVLVRWLIAQSRPDEALKVLSSIIPVAEWRRRPGLQIEAHILQAVALERLARRDQSLVALERAVELAEPSGYVRIFVDEGQEVAQLLKQAASRGLRPGYIRRLLTAFGELTQAPLSPPAAQPLIEPLSKREFDVLRFLDTHLSSTEIAGELFISPNTARFHIKNIYSKLGVHRRADAVVRARELGLL